MEKCERWGSQNLWGGFRTLPVFCAQQCEKLDQPMTISEPKQDVKDANTRPHQERQDERRRPRFGKLLLKDFDDADC